MAAGLAVACGSSTPLPGGGSQKLTVVVVVVDSLEPHEVGPTMPNINALASQGTFYEESRSVFAAETIPNHVAMMTGVYPDRNGVPANSFIDDFEADEIEDVNISIPEVLTANTLFTWINSKCAGSGEPSLRTGAVLSKKYLYEVFLGDAADPDRQNDDPAVFNLPPDEYWNPQSSPAYLPDPDEHTPDVPTMTEARARLPLVDFLFINLGDVDRLAHGSGEEARNSAKSDTDAQVGLLVQDLQDAGRWENTVLFIVSDHGMDYAVPGPSSTISLQDTLDSVTACGFEPMIAVPEGGTEGIFILNRQASTPSRRQTLRAARSCILGLESCATLCPTAVAPFNQSLIGDAWYAEDDSADPAGNQPPGIDSGHPNGGGLRVWALAGNKFSEPLEDDRAVLPGNHGHPATLRNTFIVTGGSAWLRRGQRIAASVSDPTPLDRLPEQSENVDVAPTVAWLLGLNLAAAEFPDGEGFDGRILKEAFVQFDGDGDAPPPTSCGSF